jgi:membrane dipeptidase
MKKYLALFAMVGAFACQQATEPPPEVEVSLEQKAQELAQKMLIVDTHIDVPYRLEDKWEDISQATESGDFDYPRAKAGGLNVPFMSVYVAAEYQKTGNAKQIADGLIDMVEKFAADWPDKFAMATSVADVKRQFSEGKISLALGMENGAPIGNELENLEHFHARGIRYITLTHSKWNQISDSSYDPERKWKGLSEFGREVVVAMNILGIMIDVSHITDEAFFQVTELSQAPVIASHSSCRHFTPGWERNMSDEMIQRLAENGGVIQINFGSSFLRGDYQKAMDELRAYAEEHSIDLNSEDGKRLRRERGIDYADVTDVVAHIDHVVRMVGIDHVGLGSDFDGVGDSLPTGLKDVSGYPNLIHELLKKGYSDEDIEKICSGNLLRVWSEVERIAAELQAAE